MLRLIPRSTVLGVLAFILVCVPGLAQCSGAWSTQFADPAAYYTTCMVAHDDGTGLGLFLGVNIAPGPPPPANSYGVVRWRGPGSALERVGGHSALGPNVNALAVFDDGGGPALYATGAFLTAGATPVSRIARWNGSVWQPLGSGLDGEGHALAVYDDGTGAALYVAGKFTAAGGIAAAGVARWNGSSWSAVATALAPPPGTPIWPAPIVDSLAVFDPGTGPRLYASGIFSSVNGVPANHIASFDGAAWAPLGSGIVPISGYGSPIRTMHAHDDGFGLKLYVGGTFTGAGGGAIPSIARWNGTAWSAVGANLPGYVNTLTTWSSPAGSRLVVGGDFGWSSPQVQLWDGVAWSSGNNMLGHTAYIAGTFDYGSGEKLYTVGNLVDVGPPVGQSIPHVFQEYDGQNWASPTGQGLQGYGSSATVKALVIHDDGSGPHLYAGGDLSAASGSPVSNVVRWNGASWSAVGVVAPVVFAMASIPTGPNAGLYSGGAYDSGSTFSAYVRKWTGTSWAQFGLPFNANVYTLTSFDFGGGPTVVVGGTFPAVTGGLQVNGIARWTGSAWAPLGSGMQGGGVLAAAVYDDGAGPALYVGGAFTSASGVPANRIAKWNGSAWVSLGSGMAGGSASIFALHVHDDGSGPALYAGGSFTSAGGVPASNIARWNGTSWSPVGGGISGFGNTVLVLQTFDDGGGSRLYAGGSFTSAGGTAVSHLASWDGSDWSNAHSGVSNSGTDQFGQFGVEARALATFAGPAGPSLFVGGRFNQAGIVSSLNIAELASARPRLILSQPSGPGSGVFISNSNLAVGAEYFNIFSVEPAPLGPGSGPLLGLYATNLAPLYGQVLLPVGALPFHFVAPVPSLSFGPYPGPPGLVLEGVCFDFSGGTLGCVSSVPHFLIQ